MRTRGLAALLVAAAVLVGGLFTAPAVGASEPYCLNGKTTTLPASVWYDGGGGTLYADLAEHIINTSVPSGLFYVGNYPGDDVVYAWIPDYVGDTPEGIFEDGYSTNTISRGVCDETHFGVCKLLPRADGTTGLFQVVTQAQWNDPKSPFFDAPAANWIEGLGLTCDNPVALGYKDAGYKVAWGGKKDPNADPRATRGSGNNDIYPYFTK